MNEAANSFFFLKKRSTSSLALAPHPVPHMAPPTPSAGISVSVCGRSGQCFRSYPRNYTSVWLSAPAPGPQDVGTRYQTLLIACRLLTSLLLPIRYPTPTPLPVWPALFTRPLSLSLRPSVFYLSQDNEHKTTFCSLIS